jgi:hypothetical protein
MDSPQPWILCTLCLLHEAITAGALLVSRAGGKYDQKGESRL